MPNLLRKSLARTYLAIQSLAFFTCSVATPLPNITTSNHTLSSNNNNNDIGAHCTKAPTWLADGLNRNDCIYIIDFIWRNEALPRESQQYEFTSPGATSKTTLPKIVTPRKYRWQTCVVTLAMLDRFRPRELPGSDFRDRYEETDVATFEGVWSAAFRIEFNCRYNWEAGWLAMGIHGSIGVLMMTSGSAEDRNIPDGPPHVAGVIPASSDFITLPNITSFIGSDDRKSS